METLTVTAKIQVLVSDTDKVLLDRTLSAYRDACCFVSDHVFETHDLKQFSLNEKLYTDLRDRFGLKSQMAQSVIKTVIARYRTILENQHRWLKAEFQKPQYDLVCDTDTYRFGTAKLVSKHGKYFLHIPVTRSIEECRNEDVCNVVGTDRGINFIVATYDSRHKSGFVSGRTVKQKRAHYKELRRELQRVHTPSSRRRIREIGQRENRWMQDVNHCVSKALVENNPSNTLFVLEDLTGIRSATEKVRLKDRYTCVSWTFYDLEQKLIYKARLHKDKVIKVDPAYTSQCCPVCGHTERANRNKKLHLFRCRNCGYRSNDDRVGAMNIYTLGTMYVSGDSNPRFGARKTK